MPSAAQASGGATSTVTTGAGGATSNVIGAGGGISDEIGAGGTKPCIDTSNDPDNCGRCGNVCGTFKLATAQSPRSIAVDATSVYWAAEGTTPYDGALMKVPREGGTPVSLSSGQDIGQIAADATSIYFTIPSGGKVMKVAKSGGTPTLLAANQNPYSIAVDADSVYWTTGTPGCPVDGGPCMPDNAVMKAPIGGGAAKAIASHLEHLGNIATDATNVYWTVTGDNLANGAVFKAPRNGGAPVALATHQLYVREEIALSASNVYWIQARQADGGGGTAVVTVPIQGGSITEVAPAGGLLGADRKGLYLVDQLGIVMKPFDGGSSVRILVVGGNVAPVAVALDATNIYWANQLQYDGSIMTLNAPTCSAGQCACPGDQSLCFGACIDLKTDPANCGTCGNVCGDRVACTNGRCAT